MRVQRGGAAVSDYDLAVDFMDMTDDMRLWTRVVDGRPGFEAVAGQYVIVGDHDADPRVARVITVEDDLIEVEVLPGSVESHRDLLPST